MTNNPVAARRAVPTTVHVKVPATIANLGPGYDALGLAVNLFNDVTLTCDPPRAREPGDLEAALGRLEPAVEVEGEGVGDIERDRRNLVFRAACAVFRQAGCAPAKIDLHLKSGIPFQRGLGSSAAAVVAGVVAADAVCGESLNANALLNLAAKLEGHPDNAAPALVGGLTVCLKTDDGFRVERFEIPDVYRVVLCIPDVKVSTPAARKVVPKTYDIGDTVFAMSRAAALVGLLTQGRTEGLRETMRDSLHQPYRLPLVPGLAEALEAALESGALGAVVSGSGPTLAAFVAKDTKAGRVQAIGEAMVAALAQRGTQGSFRPVALQSRGCMVTKG